MASVTSSSLRRLSSSRPSCRSLLGFGGFSVRNQGGSLLASIGGRAAAMGEGTSIKSGIIGTAVRGLSNNALGIRKGPLVSLLANGSCSTDVMGTVVGQRRFSSSSEEKNRNAIPHPDVPTEEFWTDDPTQSKPQGKKNYTWVKQKKATKRAGHLLHVLNLEGMREIEQERSIPVFRSGDALQITYTRSIQSEEEVTINGICIGRKHRGLGSTFKVLSVLQGTTIEFTFHVYSPLIRKIIVIQESFLHRGRKKTRRAKLNYLKGLPQSRYLVRDGFAADRLRRIDHQRKKAAEKSAKEE